LFSCSVCNAEKSGQLIRLYVGVTGCASYSNSVLEPMYVLPEFNGAGNGTGNGWFVGGGRIDIFNAPTRALAANQYQLYDANKSLLARNSGSGVGAVVGLEISVFRIRMSLEADCTQLGYKAEKEKHSLLDDFSCGLSYRAGIKLGNYFIPYVLAGIECNLIKKRGDNPHFKGNSRASFRFDGDPAPTYMNAVTRAYSVDDRRRIQGLRLGAGFEFEFLDHFRFRFDGLWTLRKSYYKSFRTENEILGQIFSINSVGLNLRYKKFTTRFGVVMLF
jgi:opacity protein-like surface antigen